MILVWQKVTVLPVLKLLKCMCFHDPVCRSVQVLLGKQIRLALRMILQLCTSKFSFQLVVSFRSLSDFPLFPGSLKGVLLNGIRFCLFRVVGEGYKGTWIQTFILQLAKPVRAGESRSKKFNRREPMGKKPVSLRRYGELWKETYFRKAIASEMQWLVWNERGKANFGWEMRNQKDANKTTLVLVATAVSQICFCYGLPCSIYFYLFQCFSWF